jgi:2-polyprenyl-3-methyl-5-hydroxy-6-metoxy-1,4-benzoquinol methylase
MKYAADVVRAVWRYKSTIHSGKAYPEFREYFVHYPPKECRYSSHYYFEQLAGRDQDLLDIGCGEGFLAERIAAHGNRIVGIDLLPVPRMRHAFADYISADISHGLGDVLPALGGRRFDKILLMDVLEHLEQPETLLTQCRGLLKPGGTILVSVPNVANVTVRLGLLFGRFEYQPRGILDATHLRFFTRKSIRRMIEAAGWDVVREEATVMPVELALGVSATNPVMKAINRILRLFTRAMPGLMSYQIVVLARPVDSYLRLTGGK